MTELPFLTVDVFTERPFLGNPVAVVLDADALSTDTMQRIARWTNLSETTFVVRPQEAEADYGLRIFTPDRELPFAGHPTLGSAAAAIAAGRVVPRDGRLVQACAAGRVALRVEAGGSRLHFQVPASHIEPVSPDDAVALGHALGVAGESLRFERIDVGAVWLTAELPNAAALLALRPDFAAVAGLSRRLRATGVTLHAAHSPGTLGADGVPLDIEVRSFAPAAGVPEDPVCGSGNACVALQRRTDVGPRAYVAAQGAAIGRAGRITVAYRGDAVEIGGATVVCARGLLRVD